MKGTEMIVEFVGGPFDGFCQSVAATLDELSSIVALPINENVFRMLDQKPRGPIKPSRTVAVYELNLTRACQYRFLGSCLAVELKLENWQV